MKLLRHSTARAQNGWISLPITLFITGIGLVTLGGVVSWSKTSSRLTDRNNEYFVAAAAAEAGTEKAITYMFRDFREYAVLTNLDYYRTKVPDTPEMTARFSFYDVNHNSGKITIEPFYPDGQTNAFASGYRIISNARSLDPDDTVVAAVKQVVTFNNDPIFQYAIYYSLDMEIHPGKPMTIVGKVHGQQDIYYSADQSLTFRQNVTAVGDLYRRRHVDSGMSSQGGTVNQPPPPYVFMNNAPSKTLHVGTNNSPEAVHAILEVPPGYEDINSEMGKQRLYNNVDLILTVNDSNIVAKTGPRLVTQATISNGMLTNVVTTNSTFQNSRENKKVVSTDINVGNLTTWIDNPTNAINNIVKNERNHKINSMYVDDQRTRAATNQAGVRVKNGESLPSDGLTVVTDDPLYVQGHYNAPITTPGSTNTLDAVPAALMGDAITVLSGKWKDSENQSDCTKPKAQHTTVNAAFMAGIVPTKLYDDGRRGYSGGVENYPRFLEDWDNITFTYNGSMVIMFPSLYATNSWDRKNKEYYKVPTRSWAFDVNFLKPDRLPPCTPQLRYLTRQRLELVAPFTDD